VKYEPTEDAPFSAEGGNGVSLSQSVPGPKAKKKQDRKLERRVLVEVTSKDGAFLVYDASRIIGPLRTLITGLSVMIHTDSSSTLTACSHTQYLQYAYTGVWRVICGVR
jgi:hypothetical protein